MPELYLATGRSAGEEFSSTYEGRHITLEESYLTHITHTDGFVDKGDPVYAGKIVGVALLSAAAATDLISIDTEGIWFLPVVASDDAGTDAVVAGDQLFIGSDGVVSKMSSGLPFGKSLGELSASDIAAVCAVKVHQDGLAGESKFIGRFTVSMPSFAATDVAKGFWIAPAECQLISAYEAHGTIAGQAGTLNVEKCNSGEAAGGGNAVLQTGWDLTSTVNTPVSLDAVATAEALLVAGDELRLIVTAGAATSLADAVVTCLMEWV